MPICCCIFINDHQSSLANYQHYDVHCLCSFIINRHRPLRLKAAAYGVQWRPVAAAGARVPFDRRLSNQVEAHRDSVNARPDRKTG